VAQTSARNFVSTSLPAVVAVAAAAAAVVAVAAAAAVVCAVVDAAPMLAAGSPLNLHEDHYP